MFDGYISYNDRVAMTHIQVTISSVIDSSTSHFCHITHIAILQVAALVKISGTLQFRHDTWFCALVSHWLY